MVVKTKALHQDTRTLSIGKMVLARKDAGTRYSIVTGRAVPLQLLAHGPAQLAAPPLLHDTAQLACFRGGTRALGREAGQVSLRVSQKTCACLLGVRLLLLQLSP
eukprot:2344754-Rhodomonas_salina.5